METVHIPQHVDPTAGFFFSPQTENTGTLPGMRIIFKLTPRVACTHALEVEEGGVPESNLGK